MAGAARNGDMHRTGHLCHTQDFLALPIGNPPKVGAFANRKLMCRLGDLDIGHTLPCPCPPSICCCPHVMPLAHGFKSVLVWGKRQSIIGSSIDAGEMVEGSKDVLICAASQGGFDTSTVSSVAGGNGASLADVGAGSKYA